MFKITQRKEKDFLRGYLDCDWIKVTLIIQR